MPGWRGHMWVCVVCLWVGWWVGGDGCWCCGREGYLIGVDGRVGVEGEGGQRVSWLVDVVLHPFFPMSVSDEPLVFMLVMQAQVAEAEQRLAKVEGERRRLKEEMQVCRCVCVCSCLLYVCVFGWICLFFYHTRGRVSSFVRSESITNR